MTLKNNSRKSTAKRDIRSFEPEDENIRKALDKAKSSVGGVKRLVNEAIRLYGDEAMLNLLKRDAQLAQDRYEAALKEFNARSKKNAHSKKQADDVSQTRLKKLVKQVGEAKSREVLQAMRAEN